MLEKGIEAANAAWNDGVEEGIEELKKISQEIRVLILDMLTKAGSGHPGGSLSLVELLVVLFMKVLKRTKANAGEKERDRFVLSKGHGVPVVYAILCYLGIIEKETLWTLREVGSCLQGHPDVERLPYVEASTGSLGQGLSISEGMALGSKLDGNGKRVYSVIGDGEIQEGQIWEALMSAPKFKLDNLCVILDYNKAQLDGEVEAVMDIEPVVDKLKAFNWEVHELDGHDYKSILEGYKKAEEAKGRPVFLVAHTIKGKGIDFMEGDNKWHGVAPSEEENEAAKAFVMGKIEGKRSK